MTWFTQCERLSGTIPTHMGHAEQNVLVYRNLPAITGHLPEGVHQDHWSAGQAELIRPNGVGLVCYYHAPISGTMPTSTFCDGNSSAMPLVTTIGFGDHRLSGTAPACFYGGLTRLNTLYAFKGRVSGTVPDLTNSEDLRIFRVERNNFEELPAAFPPNLEQFMSSDNPRIDATGAQLSALLNSSHKLTDFSFTSDNMVARSLEYSTKYGTIPDIGWSALHPPVPLDCRIGEPCQVKKMTKLCSRCCRCLLLGPALFFAAVC